MNSIKVIKNLFIVLMIFMLIANIYLFINNRESSAEINDVREKNQLLEKEVEEYKEKQENISNTAREKYYNKLTEQANTFIDLTYTQKQEGYQSRKNAAEKMMDEELFKTYFTAENYIKQDITSSVEDKKLFIEKLEGNQKEVKVLAQVKHRTQYKSTKNDSITNVFTEITFSKKDNNWQATNSNVIYSEEQRNAESEG